MLLKQQKQSEYLKKITFFLGGIASSIAWNSVLSSFDYFEEKFPNKNVSFIFGIPLYLASLLFSFLSYSLTKYTSIHQRVLGSLFIIAVFVFFLPIEAHLFQNSFGFNLIIWLLFLLGTATTILQCTLVSYANTIPGDSVSMFFAGNGFAGLIFSGLRAFILILMGTAQTPQSALFGAILFFSVGSFFVVFSIVFYVRFIRDESIQKHELPYQGYQSIKDQKQNDDESKIVISEAQHVKKIQEKQQDSIFNQMIILLNTAKKISPIPQMCFFLFFQTFLLFPALSLKSQISFCNISWSITLIVLLFNLMVFLGECLATYRNLYTQGKIMAILILRILFIFPFLMLVKAQRNLFSDFLIIFNMIFFAFTTGFCITSVMNLAPEKVGKDDKEIVGYLMNFPVFAGIVMGNIFALGFQNV